MIGSRWGRIVNITGKSEPDGINGAFCAKAATHAWAKGLSREVGKHGITVNSIPPGRIMSEQIGRNYTPEYRQWQADNEIPVGRYGEPADIGRIGRRPHAGACSGRSGAVEGNPGRSAQRIRDMIWLSVRPSVPSSCRRPARKTSSSADGTA